MPPFPIRPGAKPVKSPKQPDTEPAGPEPARP